MKKLFRVLVLTLAVNFIAAAGAVFWLFKSGHLNRERVSAIKSMVFPKPTTAPAAKSAESSTSRPTLNLEELLAKHAGKPPAEQLEYIRQSFDVQMAQLDRAQRSLQDLQRQVLAEQKRVTEDRASLEADRKKLIAQQQEANRLATDKGFQDSLTLYESLPAKTVKTVFMGLDDATVVQYLQAMESRSAARIMKEFKTPQETERLKTLMERLRRPTSRPADVAAVSSKE